MIKIIEQEIEEYLKGFSKRDITMKLDGIIIAEIKIFIIVVGEYRTHERVALCIERIFCQHSGIQIKWIDADVVSGQRVWSKDDEISILEKESMCSFDVILWICVVKFVGIFRIIDELWYEIAWNEDRKEGKQCKQFFHNSMILSIKIVQGGVFPKYYLNFLLIPWT